MSAMTHEYRPKDNSQELVLSFLHVSFLGRPQRVGEYLCLPPLLIFRVPNFFFNFYSCHLFCEDHLVHFSAISFYGRHHPHYPQNP